LVLTDTINTEHIFINKSLFSIKSSVMFTELHSLVFLSWRFFGLGSEGAYSLFILFKNLEHLESELIYSPKRKRPLTFDQWPFPYPCFYVVFNRQAFLLLVSCSLSTYFLHCELDELLDESICIFFSHFLHLF